MIDKIVIIEDEQLNADRLRRLISAIRPNISVIAVLDSVADSIEWFKLNELPDAIMMDVRLSDGLSFDIFKKVQINCPIIFTTAYDEYAVKAFKYNGIDYLLKPIEQEELEQAINKVEQSSSLVNNQPTIDQLIDFLKPKEFRNRFLLPFKDGYKTIMVSEVSYIYVDLKITRARLTNGSEEVLLQTMEELEQQLDPKLFFRANRQFIIHIDSVAQVLNYFNAKLKLVLKGSYTEIIVSRDKASLLKTWMDY